MEPLNRNLGESLRKLYRRPLRLLDNWQCHGVVLTEWLLFRFEVDISGKTALYTLIWQRFVTFQNAVRAFDQRAIDIAASPAICSQLGSVNEFKSLKQAFPMRVASSHSLVYIKSLPPLIRPGFYAILS